MDINEIEPNSHKYKMEKAVKDAATAEPEREKRVEAVVTGATKTRKRVLGKRFADIFLSENVSDVKTYILYDVLIPAVKENVVEMLCSAVSMLFLGEANRRIRKPSSPQIGSRFNYNSISTPATTRERMPNFNRSRIAHNFDDVIFETRAEAELVLDGMIELINTYHQVTVADFYDLAGMSTTFTDNKYGWTDLRAARVVGSASRGYSIDLPRCMTLES